MSVLQYQSYYLISTKNTFMIHAEDAMKITIENF